jgi:hypothetical protein
MESVPPGVPKSVLTQNLHPAPSTQEAEQSVPVNFPEINKG